MAGRIGLDWRVGGWIGRRLGALVEGWVDWRKGAWIGGWVGGLADGWVELRADWRAGG